MVAALESYLKGSAPMRSGPLSLLAAAVQCGIIRPPDERSDSPPGGSDLVRCGRFLGAFLARVGSLGLLLRQEPCEAGLGCHARALLRVLVRIEGDSGASGDLEVILQNALAKKSKLC